jgi:hypothetical protein
MSEPHHLAVWRWLFSEPHRLAVWRWLFSGLLRLVVWQILIDVWELLIASGIKKIIYNVDIGIVPEDNPLHSHHCDDLKLQLAVCSRLSVPWHWVSVTSAFELWFSVLLHCVVLSVVASVTEEQAVAIFGTSVTRIHSHNAEDSMWLQWKPRVPSINIVFNCY